MRRMTVVSRWHDPTAVLDRALGIEKWACCIVEGLHWIIASEFCVSLALR